MSRGWRYIAQRLTGDNAGEFLDWDLPLEGVELERVLSGAPTLDATISPKFSRLVGSDGQLLLDDRWNTAIWAENDGDIRGGGILVQSGFQGPDWRIGTVGFSGYPQDMPYVGAWYGVQIDPLDILRQIWDHLQSQPGGDLGLEVSDLKTGLKIGTELEQVEFDTQSGPLSFESGPYKLNWYQNHDLAGDIDKLAENTPFDYTERHFWDGDESIRHALDLGYPKIGNKRDDLRFVFGENIFESPSIERDGYDFATEAMVLGAGEGRRMRRGSSFRPRLGLRRVAVISDPTLRSVRDCNARANAEMQWRQKLDDIGEIVVRDHPHAPLGAIDLGDTIILEGRASEWREVDMQVRVMAIRIRPEEANSAVYTVTRTDRLA